MAPMNKHTFPPIRRSQELLQRAEGIIPAYTQTLAKGPQQYVQGVAPSYAQRGKGAYLWDVDDNRYLDYTMGVGPVILGYSHPVINRAIEEQLHDGITFSLMHPLEVEVAELLREMIPSIECVRYSKTGCDVTSAAVRLARAHTGRNTILCCGYHGWHDWYIAVTDRSAGIPEAVKNLTYTFTYNNIQSVIDAVDDDTAAIILEPVVFEEPQDGFLEDLRELCNERGIVLIFDEMWTGFRIAGGGAQEYYDVEADLVCYSKAIANGMPLSVLAGKADIMRHLEHDVFFFTTFGGEALSLAAAKATMKIIRDESIPIRIHAIGGALKDGINDAKEQFGCDFMSCQGLGMRTIINFNSSYGDPLLMKSYLQQELLIRGVLWSGTHNISAAHTQHDIDHTIGAYREILPSLKEHVDSGTLAAALHGKPVEPVFRKTSNFNMKPRHNDGVLQK
jgi:glutamate-1-semialdehyde aminotransferase